MTLALEAHGITKVFPGVVANDHIDFSLEEGEIHALLGENGAGKTTLMNILYGLWQADEGEIFIRGERVAFHDPSDAIARGIGMVHQHFMLVPVLTVAENIMLGMESVRAGIFLDQKAVAQRITELSKRYGLQVDPRDYIKDLPVGVQQRVEILKILYREAEILILDEPTAVLTPQEVEELFQILRNLVQQQKSIIFITHKLNEVLEVADRITVLRDGRVMGTTKPEATTDRELASMMVGREVMLTVDKAAPTVGEVVLEVQDLRVSDDRGHRAVNGVSLQVRAGEILGVAGVQGNGQTELVEALAGLRNPEAGRFSIGGRDMTGADPRSILERGVAHIPEDRQKVGLVLPFPVHDNLVLNTYYQSPFARGVVLQAESIIRAATERAGQFDVRTPSVYVPVATLSGGNQQKVIVARELSRPIQLLIAAQPTRGLDVGSVEYIHRQLVLMRDGGIAVLVVSTELEEILSLADRVAVMFRGRIVKTLDTKEATPEALGLLMAGVEAA